MTTILEDLGIRGIPAFQEYALLGSILTGNPILLIGPPGTAKTEIVAQIGAALREYSRKMLPDKPKEWFNYQLYDCSKLNPEDLIGFVNLREMENGQAKIIETPSTIWDKHLVCFDEFNRMDPDRQANLFEIIRSRRCLGKETNTLFIVNCMNPNTDEGTLPLSDALIDRHMFYLSIDAFNRMKKEDREYITQRVGAKDSVGLPFWNRAMKSEFVVEEQVNDRLAEVGTRIRNLLKTAANENLPALEKTMGGTVTEFISKLAETLTDKDKNYLITGRRAGMMRTGILAVMAVSEAASKILETDPIPLQELFSSAVLCSLPIHCGTTSSEDVSRLVAEVRDSVEALFNEVSKDDPALLIQELYSQKDPVERLRIILDHPDIDILSRTKNWNEILTSINSSMVRFLSCIQTIHKILPLEVEQRLQEMCQDLDQHESEVLVDEESPLSALIPVLDVYKRAYKDHPLKLMLLHDLVDYYLANTDNGISSVVKGIALIERFTETT